MSITGMINDKKRYRAYVARKASLPTPYRAALEAVDRYVMRMVGSDGNALMELLEDLVDLFEQSAADGTPVGTVVGDDPVDFTETFLANYSGNLWINKERERLVASIEAITSEENTR